MKKNLSSFLKVEGTGNDFLLFEEKAPPTIDANWMARVCARHTGAGADGVIFVWNEASRWHWRFFNGDGSETDLCGNAARCVGRYLQSREPNQKHWNWLGNLGEFTARLESDDRIAVNWPAAKIVKFEVPDDLLQWTVGFNDHGLAMIEWWQVGVPHLVLVNHEVWNIEQRITVNALLRSYPALGEGGANVTWLSMKTFDAVTFERGVEAETLACGSGAMAAFFTLQDFARENGHKDIPHSAKFNFPGGELEVVEENSKKHWLVGSARIVFKGELA